MRVAVLVATVVAAVLVGTGLGWSPGADAAFPGRDGRIAWVESVFEGSDASLDSPAGRQFFVFQRPHSGEMRNEGGELVCDERYPSDPCPYQDPSFSPDGETVVLEAQRARSPDAPLPRAGEPLPARKPVLAVVGADETPAGSEVETLPDLTDADRDPAWSPDGRQIIFSGDVNGNRDLYVVNRDGSGLRRLTSHPGVDREPAWSTRGEIAFVRGNVLYRIRPDGTGLKRLDRRGRVPDWSPDGRRLVFSRERRLFILRRDGRHYRRVLRRGRSLYPAWSPSGRRIAFQRKFDIFTVGARGKRLRRVYDWPGLAGPGSRAQYAPRNIDWGPRQR